MRPYIPAVAWGEVSFYSWMGSTTTNLINLLTAYLWVIIVIEVYRSQKVQRAVEPLVSYGRMGLTNYIVQSVAGVFIFSGFGLDSFGSFPERIGLPCLYRHTNRN